MSTFSRYLRIWLASARYSLARAMMFRGDLFVWAMVELVWISVNVLMVAVVYSHTRSVAGWNEYEMLLLVGTSMLIQRFLMGFFWSGIFEMGRNVRSGAFDFVLAQPGDPLFMASTRKLELDGLLNSVVAGALVVFAVGRLGFHPGPADLALYACMVACGVVIHYSALVLAMSLSFWITSSQGVEGSYFTLMEFSRLPPVSSCTDSSPPGPQGCARPPSFGFSLRWWCSGSASGATQAPAHERRPRQP